MSKRNKRRKEVNIETVFEEIEAMDMDKIIQIVDDVPEPDYSEAVIPKHIPTVRGSSENKEAGIVFVASMNNRANPIRYNGTTIVIPAVGKIKLRKNWIESTPIGVRIFES